VLATMDDIIDMGSIRGHHLGESKGKKRSADGAVLKRPSSANRRFDRADTGGEDRTGEARDPQKACQHSH
jgi:hypothetical protein